MVAFRCLRIETVSPNIVCACQATSARNRCLERVQGIILQNRRENPLSSNSGHARILVCKCTIQTCRLMLTHSKYISCICTCNLRKRIGSYCGNEISSVRYKCVTSGMARSNSTLRRKPYASCSTRQKSIQMTSHRR